MARPDAARAPEPVADRLDVSQHGVVADAQLVGRLRVRETVTTDEAHDLQLAGGEFPHVATWASSTRWISDHGVPFWRSSRIAISVSLRTASDWKPA